MTTLRWHTTRKRLAPCLATICCSLVLAPLAGAADQALVCGPPDLDRPRIGLVLGGGGARGGAHVGVLKVIESMNIPVDCVAGTSMGSIIGGLYASGMRPEEIEQALATMDWDDLFSDSPPRQDLSFRRKRDDDLNLIGARVGVSSNGLKLPTAVIMGQKFDLALNELTMPVSNIRDFNQLPIPYRAVATDIATGKAVVLDGGNLALSIRASMSVPGAFAGAEIDGKLLVDGGVANNVPVDVVRAMGADYVIAVDVGSPMLTQDQIESSLDVVSQLTNILTRRNVEEQLATLREGDVLVLPQLGDFSSTDFNHVTKTIPIGTAAAEAQRDALARLAITEPDFQLHLARRARPDHTPPVLAFVELDNQSRLHDDFIQSRITAAPGQPLDVAQLERDIGQLYGLDVFESVRYEFAERDGERGIIIRAREKRWGPNYLQMGMNISSDWEGDTAFNLSVAHTRTIANALNAEWRTLAQVGDEPKLFSEWYQPLDVDSRFYIKPSVAIIDTEKADVYEDGDRIADYRVTRHGGALAGGIELGSSADFQVGTRYYLGDVSVNTGDTSLPNDSFNQGTLFTRLHIDHLNDPYFPTEGGSALLQWQGNYQWLGSDDTFQYLGADTFGATTFERYTVFGGLRLESIPGSDAPFYGRIRIGGFQNTSGYQFNELSGQHHALARLGVMRRVNNLKWLPAWLGATLELTDLAEDKDDFLDDYSDTIFGGNVFIGANTVVGPVIFSWGNSEDGESTFFLTIGQQFNLPR